jgi:protein-export membrane protein SecD
MQRRQLWSLIIVVVVAVFALIIALPIDHPSWFDSIQFWNPEGTRSVELKQGLDLKGGLQVLLESSETATADEMDAAKQVVENRVNGLGVSEPQVQRQGDNRIIVEIPGIDNSDQAIATLRGTGLLEFVEMGQTPLLAGTLIQTDHAGGSASASATGGITPTLNPATGQPFVTVMTGADLESATIGFNQTTGQPEIQFSLRDSGRNTFATYTSAHVGDFLAIVMDKVVLSAPRINSAITDGQGVIEGQFTQEEARSLAIQMQYGALPVPLNVVDIRSVGATLGADSVNSSVIAGVIGLATVLIFMLVYFRLPGLLADVALIVFVLINIAIFKLVPVTLTLPGIAGFLLATGMAVDANVLIFARMKEEMRAGKPVRAAVDAGFNRAWTAILDSNLSTIISGLILLYFGGTFGASSVQGFAITLIIGVLTSMFTAVFVTRVLMHLVFNRPSMGETVATKPWLVGA